MSMKGQAIFTYSGTTPEEEGGIADQVALSQTINENGFDKSELPCIYLLEIVPGSMKNAKFGCGKGKSKIEDLVQFIKDY